MALSRVEALTMLQPLNSGWVHQNLKKQHFASVEASKQSVVVLVYWLDLAWSLRYKKN